MLQKIPFDSIRPYLLLNISKKKISHLLLIRTIFGFKTFFVAALFTPFAFISIPDSHSLNEALFWLFNIFVLVISLNLLIQIIKLIFWNNFKTLGFFTSLIVVTAILRELYVFNTGELSGYIFSAFLQQPLALLISIGAFIPLYRINCTLLRQEYYIDKSPKKEKKISDNILYDMLGVFGSNADLIKFNLKQIFRNKRGKMSYLYWLGMFLFMGLLMKDVLFGNQSSNIMSYFIVLFLPAGFLYQHNQFFFPWDSYQADFVHTAKIDFRKYMFARIYTVIILIQPIYLMTFLLGIFSRDLLYISLSSFLLNIGYSSFVLIILSIFSVREIDVNQSIFFNYQGVSAFQYFSVIILFLLPGLVLLIFRNNPMWAYLVNGLIGLSGILLKDKWMDLINNIFLKRKHEILEELR
ncbi:MAG: hypothetical protein GF417_06170 [Candidatus Latescibacteria bacterium]|nr:hypothetical protein [Candidatus Latescibacterota bacterium]